MATVNHVGQGMVGLPVTLISSVRLDKPLTGEVVLADQENDFLTVKWYGTLGNNTGKYNCEKFQTKMVDDTLTLVLHLD